MARPRKEGLDYFPLDTEFDEKVEMLVVEHGNDGLVVFIRALQSIYKTFDGELSISGVLHRKTFANRAKIGLDRWELIVETCVELGLFDPEAYSERKVLTSSGVKRRLGKINGEREAGRNRALASLRNSSAKNPPQNGRRKGEEPPKNLRKTPESTKGSSSTDDRSTGGTVLEIGQVPPKPPEAASPGVLTFRDPSTGFVRTTQRIRMTPEQRHDIESEFGADLLSGELGAMDDWLLSKGHTRKDYPAFCRNWLRKAAAQQRARAAQSRGRESPASRFMQMAEEEFTREGDKPR